MLIMDFNESMTWGKFVVYKNKIVVWSKTSENDV